MVGNGDCNHKIYILYFNFLGDSKSRGTSELHHWFKSYNNFAKKKSELFLLDKVVKLVGGGFVINVAYPV